jgi:hypothetical protein
VMVKTEPPVLQMRICRVTVEPARTLPKCMAVGTPLSQPPSSVDTAMVAMGGLPADAENIMLSTPPSDQTVTRMAKEPDDCVLKTRGTPILSPAAML